MVAATPETLGIDLGSLGPAQHTPSTARWQSVELLDIDMDQLARPVPDETDRQGGRTVETAQS
jgi:hypothetical protein